MHTSIRAACAALLAACLSAGCASMDGRHDWWAVRAIGSGDAGRLVSTSHVNHGKPTADVAVAPRLLREAARGQVSIALHHDATLAADWSGSAWKFTRELDKALDWLQRLAGPRGVRVVVTLVDDAHARDVERTHGGTTPVVDLVVAVPPDAASQSAVVGRALAKALHETAHAQAATSEDTGANRFADEYAAALVESCYLLDTLRPGDVVALNVAGRHAPTDNYAIEQSRAAAGAVVRELRALARADKLQADDADVQAALHARCDIER